MPQNHRWAIHVLVVVDVKIRSTDCSSLHLDLQLIRLWNRFRHLQYFEISDPWSCF